MHKRGKARHMSSIQYLMFFGNHQTIKQKMLKASKKKSYQILAKCRRSPSHISIKKEFLKNFATLLKKKTPIQVFTNSLNTLFYRTPPVAASESGD